MEAKLIWRNITRKNLSLKDEGAFLIQVTFNTLLPFLGGMAVLSGQFFAGMVLVALPLFFQLSVMPSNVVINEN